MIIIITNVYQILIAGVLMYFYDKLRDLRKLKGYTIRELSDRSGVSAAYISQMENGSRGIPSPEVLMKLSEGLNTSYEELMEIAGYLQTSARSSGNPKTKSPVNLRRFLHENEIIFDGIVLTEQDKEWVERVLTALFWKQKQNKHDT
ncbi:transcriptional repressor-like protein [Paenibacillus larvae subsp. larvae]|nr:helix-turn-helix transcriptional regulator [Paenibacillus larvae]AVF25479.1 transcriptional repressor-like protein [Paenibacillus larvae subsp. larvae]AVF30256.1 transcriptional repressor-like protein [Paenibacillus larvae subsp. larvae]AVG11603.1 transcriptional repressor-like protein [Paenibacillus larvae subsp. larvae DSM 25430]MCY7518633.1 helix-turn-helix domain-containing protein [Paenibacillus larvae]MCY9501415.1 helix-turn-helix domain-containing protein [Paenibacillus larvae]